MAKNQIVARQVGHIEPMTVRLHGLLRSYPKNVGILKEFIQNADDAGASRVHITLDLRTYSGELPAPGMEALLGPALLISNDKTFSDDDFAGIERLGDSGKVRQPNKTGRFGLGFTASYNVTDYPSVLSRNRLLVFDPHKHMPPSKESGGFGYDLTPELWEEYPALLHPFRVAGLRRGLTSLDSTSFRLPLRQPESGSHICDEPFRKEDCDRLFENLAQIGDGLLLFLKNVLAIQVDQIRRDGTRRTLLTLETLNPDEVEANRKVIREAIELHVNGAGPERTVSYRHDVRVKWKGKPHEAYWRVGAGLYQDAHGMLARAAAVMREHGDKAVPWAGAAGLLEKRGDGTLVPMPVRGQIHCSLPLAATAEGVFPVHVNGFFDIDSERHALIEDESRIGENADRGRRWNESLLQHAVARAYAEMLAAMTQEVATNDAESLYQLFPVVESTPPGLMGHLPRSVYLQLADKAVICRGGTARSWAPIRDVHPLPKNWDGLHEPLLAMGMPLPEPELPAQVLDGFEAAKVLVQRLEPVMVRQRLNTQRDVNVALEEAENPGLRQRDWVSNLLRFCLQGAGEHELAHLPLAILDDGRLHTFGTLDLYLAGPDERELLPRPDWFLDPSFARDTRLTEQPKSRLFNVTPQRFMHLLGVLLGEWNKGAPHAWESRAAQPPNERWLTSLYKYLSSRKLQEGTLEHLKPLAIVPDQFGRLHKPSTTATPLLPSVEQSRDKGLMAAIKAFSVPLVHGRPSLLEQIRAFERLNPKKFIWPLTGPDLVDTLEAFQSSWSSSVPRYEPGLHDPLLDFLADSKWQNAWMDDTLSKLRSLRLFPTADDQLVALSDSGVYAPADYSPPPVAGSLKLLKNNPKWKWLYQQLNVHPLNRARLVREVLVPIYASLSLDAQREALSWLRTNLNIACTEAEREAPGGSEALRNTVAQAPLVRGSDGTLHACATLYDPRVSTIRDILGETARFPDTAKTYSSGVKEWLSFFASLRMADTPKQEDLLARLDALADLAEAEGSGTVLDALQRVYEYLDRNWHRFEETPIANALAQRRWLPAQRDPRSLACYAGAVIPEDRLYSPTELYPANLGHLVASQQPIAAFPRPRSHTFGEAIGLPSEASLEVVVAHLDELLEVWDREGEGIRVEVLEGSLRTIYARFGQLCTRATEADEEDDPSDGARSTELVWLREHYALQPCLWYPREQRFLLPRYVFRSPAPWLSPYRTTLKAKEKLIDLGYRALGRREEPEVEDLLEVLEQMAEQYQDDPLPEDASSQVLRILQQLTLRSGLEPLPLDVRSRLRVLTASSRLALATEVLWNDAPWFDDRLDHERVPLLSPKITQALIDAAGIQRLSKHMREQLAEEPVRSADSGFRKRCLDFTRKLRTPEFRRGLRRLIRAQHEEEHPGELEWLAKVLVSPATELRTELRLGNRQVGQGSADTFFDAEEKAIWLSEQVKEDASTFLAIAIDQQLDSHMLKDKLPLVRMLDREPAAIDELLTKLKIPQLREELADDETWEAPIEAEEMEFQAPPEMSGQDPGEEASAETSEPEYDAAPWVPDHTSGGVADEEVAETEVGTDPEEETGTEAEGPSTRPEAVQEQQAVQEDTGEDEFGGTEPTGELNRATKPRPPTRAGPRRVAPGVFTNGTVRPRGEFGEGQVATGKARPAGWSGETADAQQRDDATPNRPAVLTQEVARSRTNAFPLAPVGSFGVQPPTRSGDGRGKTRSDSERPEKRRVVTYVFPEGFPTQEEEDLADGERSENREIAEAAVARVMAHEQAEQRQPNEKDWYHVGYDVESSDHEETRFIEVKGIDGPWTEAGVSLTRAQFECARQYGRSFWLYVVEYARDDERYQVHPIRDPAGQITQFRFDRGWRFLSAPE